MRFTVFFVVMLSLGLPLTGCSTSKPFMPQSQYPTDPWVKGYSNPDDCIGGEQLAALNFAMPEYPSSAYRKGRQGWVIMRLDVDASGMTQNVEVERSVPDGMFENNAIKAVKAWTFEPPRKGALENCRVLLRFRAGSVTLGG